MVCQRVSQMNIGTSHVLMLIVIVCCMTISYIRYGTVHVANVSQRLDFNGGRELADMRCNAGGPAKHPGLWGEAHP